MKRDLRRFSGALIAIVLFWLSAGLAFYVYAGYPILLAVFRRVTKCTMAKKQTEPSV